MVLPFSRALLLSTSVAALYASGLTAYAVGSNEPEFVADFAGVLNSGTEYYRSGGSDTTFSSVFTHTKGDNNPFTMTDSDGNLKWAPHNLALQTQGSAGMTNFRSTDAENVTTDPDGTSLASRLTEDSTASNSHGIYTTTGAAQNGRLCRCECYMKQGDRRYVVLGAFSSSDVSVTSPLLAYFDLQAGTVNNIYAEDAGIESASDGWYLCWVEFIGTSTAFRPTIYLATGTSLGDQIFSGNPATYPVGIYFYNLRVYRSDLGMVNNPDRGDSYVPTTTAARFLPRRNHYLYNGSTYDNAGILIEPAAATNLVTQSNNLSTTWTETSTNRSQLGTPGTGPDGVSNSAQLIEVGSATGVNNRGYFIGITSTAVAHAYSVYLKKASGGTGWVWIATFDATGGLKYSYFDLNTGTVGTAASGHTLTIENVGNGWYRCCVVNTYASTTTMRVYVGLATADGASTVDQATYPQGTGWFYHYGSQSEVGSVPTSYIPTAGSTVTRAAETLTAAGSSLPANTTGVSVQMQGRMSYADLGTEAQRTFWRWYNGASDFLLCDLDTDGADTGEVNANQSDTTGGAGTVAIDAYSPGINVAYNIASRHSNTDVNLAVDGTAGTADATPTALHDASSDTFQVAHALQGSVGMLRVWGVGLSDTDLESAS